MELWYGIHAVLLRAASESAFHVPRYRGIHIAQDLLLDIWGNSVVLYPVFLHCHIDIALLKFKNAIYNYIVLDGPGSFNFICARRWTQAEGAPLIGESTAIGGFEFGVSMRTNVLISSLTRNTEVVLNFIQPSSILLTGHKVSYCNFSSELRVQDAAFSSILIVFIAMFANEGQNMWGHQPVPFSLESERISNISATIEFAVTIAVTLETALLLQYSAIPICFLFVFYQHSPLCTTFFLWHLACIANLAKPHPNQGSTVELWSTPVFFSTNRFLSQQGYSRMVLSRFF